MQRSEQKRALSIADCFMLDTKATREALASIKRLCYGIIRKRDHGAPGGGLFFFFVTPMAMAMCFE